MKFRCFAFALILVASVLGCGGGRDPWADRPGPKVMAYFPPLYSLAAAIAGDDAQVMSLITHVGPHHFEPTARDALALRRADLFLTIGLGLDDAVARKIASTSGNTKLKLVQLGTLIPKDTLNEGGCSCGHKHAPDEHHHGADHAVEYDPHVWLGIAEAQKMIAGIRDELSAIDPAHADGYRARAAALSERIDQLQADGKAMLAAKKETPKVVSFHPSMFYFARSFGVDVVDTIEAPGYEPSAKKLQAVVDACKKNHARIIAVEPQYASRSDAARTIMKELKGAGIDAELIELDPLETANQEELRPDYYERKMRTNIENLARALK